MHSPSSKFSRRSLLAAATSASAATGESGVYTLSRPEIRLLDDIGRRAFRYFADASDPKTGLVLDRRTFTGERTSRFPNVASIAATGFGLTAWCIGADRKWTPQNEAINRVRTSLRFFAEQATHNHGWFYHFLDSNSGEAIARSEISSIDTALLLAGALTARQYFSRDREIVRLATAIYERLDFQWMLNGDPLLLSHGWRSDVGFFRPRWNSFCELMILYLLAIGSPASKIPPTSWYAWRRDTMNYDQFNYITGGPLFVHQYSHAWVDFRQRRDQRQPRTNWFQNSVIATRAHRAFCVDLASVFPGCYEPNVWGITASESAKGYVAWGGPPRDSAIDGTVVPCAAGGSLMFTPDICLPALSTMREKYGRKAWGVYGFADAFHPITGWVSPDVLGIDLGITLLSAENLRAGSVWKWFMRNDEVTNALDLVTSTA